MKKIVIVEDKPWVTQNAVEELKKRTDVQVLKVVYYPNTFGDEKEKEELIRKFEESAGLKVDTICTQEDFVNEMESLYSGKDVVFFMDYDLKGDYTKEPDSRINVRYTRYKEYGEDTDSNARRIWFYTVTGAANVEVIRNYFPERVLPVKFYKDGQLTWDSEKLDEILE